MNRLLVENSNNHNTPEAIQKAAEDARALETTTFVTDLSKVAWETPTKTRDLARQINRYALRTQASPTDRVFFRKVRKGYELKDLQLATANQKINSLEAQLEAAATRKRKRVVPDPNTDFVTLRNIEAERGIVRDEPVVLEESPENSD